MAGRLACCGAEVRAPLRTDRGRGHTRGLLIFRCDGTPSQRRCVAMLPSQSAGGPPPFCDEISVSLELLFFPLRPPDHGSRNGLGDMARHREQVSRASFYARAVVVVAGGRVHDDHTSVGWQDRSRSTLIRLRCTARPTTSPRRARRASSSAALAWVADRDDSSRRRYYIKR